MPQENAPDFFNDIAFNSRKIWVITPRHM